MPRTVLTSTHPLIWCRRKHDECKDRAARSSGFKEGCIHIVSQPQYGPILIEKIKKRMAVELSLKQVRRSLWNTGFGVTLKTKFGSPLWYMSFNTHHRLHTHHSCAIVALLLEGLGGRWGLVVQGCTLPIIAMLPVNIFSDFFGLSFPNWLWLGDIVLILSPNCNKDKHLE